MPNRHLTALIQTSLKLAMDLDPTVTECLIHHCTSQVAAVAAIATTAARSEAKRCISRTASLLHGLRSWNVQPSEA